MELSDLETWMEKVSSKDWYWYVKCFSGNDTLSNNAHHTGRNTPWEWPSRICSVQQ